MGIFGSSEERVEEKTVDSTGHVNTNIVIQEARDTHDIAKGNEKMLTVMYIMCLLETIKIAIYLYKCFKKNLKKKYGNQQQSSD